MWITILASTEDIMSSLTLSCGCNLEEKCQKRDKISVALNPS